MKLLSKALAIAGVLLSMAWIARAQPANDNFANAWTLTTLRTNGTSVGATKEAGEPNHAFNIGGPSGWFNWTAARTGPVQIDTIGSGFDTLLAVYTGSALNALTEIASNDEAPGIGFVSLVQIQAVEDTQYRIAIDTWRPGSSFPSGGNYILNVRPLSSVAITSPANGAVFPINTPIPLEIGGEVPNPPITRVDFYRRGALIASDNTEPFSAVATNSLPGSNNFYVITFDSAGLSWTSAVVNVAVVNEGVTILAPADGASYLSSDPGALLASPIPVTA